MAKVRRSTPAPAPVAQAPATAAMAKRSAPVGAADTAATSPAAVASPPVVIEIPSSPDPSVGVGSKGGSSSNKKARKRPAPPLDLDDEIEMWTPREKWRLDEDCQILAGDPLSAITEVSPSPAAANDEIAVVAERGKVACRDYPHPRSACAKNPFNTTPHERHCDKSCFGQGDKVECYDIIKEIMIFTKLYSNLAVVADGIVSVPSGYINGHVVWLSSHQSGNGKTPARKKMVKIVDVEEQPDVVRDDDDCIEINPAEFAKKLNLKETDDVILVAAKGKIIKVEVGDKSEGLAKASYGYGSEANHEHVAAGDCIDNPYNIDEDEMGLLKVEIDEDRFVIDKPSAKLQADDHNGGQFFRGDEHEPGRYTVDVIPRKLVVKREPVDGSGLEVIPDMPVVKCEPVGDIGVEVAEESSYDYCLEVAPERKIFDEEDGEDVVVV
ncbi:hypothetical protein BAE44_0012227 [Dichanthelium oligosanthes]|uniref:Uncharacterized protein n=1 Tax=Dichanthelium oligosanthes TaxID=888268 RepID=A0A1E5VNR2_9POAL|nr:hypothetical protein BAE44_0012227 [Dichanthelium oligosanthes]